MLLLVRTTSGPVEVSAALADLTADGRLSVDVRPVPDLAPAPPASGSAHLLSVHGADRPGIVGALTSVVAAAGGNVTDLTTRLAGDLYVLVADVELPDGTDVDALTGALHEVAERLGVDVALRPADTDEL
jgi:glycine cleavage system transcriptional repressor